jgi:hypothetical protein
MTPTLSYVDYIGNVCRFIVELVNGDPPTDLRRDMFGEHSVPVGDLSTLLPVLDEALAAVADHPAGARPLEPIRMLLETYPPNLLVSDHDGSAHLHFARDGEEAVPWTARNAGAALAYVMTGDVAVTVGRCAAAGCARYFVDDSRNRSRRYCSNSCASRTTVSAHRARQRRT